MAKFTWTEDNVKALEAAVAGVDEVSQDQLKEIAEQLGTSARSVGSKLRKMEYSVQLATEAGKPKWTEDEEAVLVDFLNANAGNLTYSEIAAAVLDGKFSTKQVQGKILSLQLTEHVKPTEKAAPVRSYSVDEEAKIVELVSGGASMEAVAEAMGRPLNSVRGKCLSLQKEGRISEMPKQETSSAKAKEDILEGLDIANMTVAEIAEAVDRTERGIKATLTRRGISCADHDGAKRAAKIASQKSAE